jgi:hypothetical protein
MPSRILIASLGAIALCACTPEPEQKPATLASVQGDGRAAQPVTTPLPAAPANGWCYRGPVPNAAQDVTITIGDCPAPAPDVCPPGRASSMTLAVQSYTGGRKLMDVTQADNLFGYTAWTAPRLTYPWKNDFTIFDFPRTAGLYVAAKFVVPMNSNPSQWGAFNNLETIPGPGIDFAISERCGDFTPASPYCSADDVYGGRALPRHKLPGYAGPALCKLTPGGTYYVNIRLDDPAAGGANCIAGLCRVGVQHNHNP